MTKRYAGAVAALTSTENMYNTYRQRVIEECGEEKDIQFQNGIKEVVESVPVLNKDGSPKVDKNGEVKTVEKRSFQQTKAPIYIPACSRKQLPEHGIPVPNIIAVLLS